MKKQISLICYVLLTIGVSAVYLPMLYEKIILDPVEKTHLFYSPISWDFIYKEKIVGSVPPKAAGLAMDHHSNLAYQKADGSYVDRKTFEKHLPFIFYKNMEIWGLLPINLEGQSFDKKSIKAGRRVLELKAREIPGKAPAPALYPLLESNPGQARLVFPDDRFRMTSHAMEFINADTNEKDKSLTNAFTRALTDQGFVFPARSVNGKFTVLKPFDEGIFLVDDRYRVFHVKRVDNRPWVVKTSIAPELNIRHIKVSENRQKKYYGLALGEKKIGLISWDTYDFIPLPLADYDPDCMDLKLIFNPLYSTAVYSDRSVIRALAMDKNFLPLKSYVHNMSRANTTLGLCIRDFLFPFRFKLETPEESEFICFTVEKGSVWCLAGMVLCALVFTGALRMGKGTWPKPQAFFFVALTGIYGLIVAAILDFDQ
ncbi:MAG: DUF4857 domain-containing protein [Desulfobacteraceae bacterium]|nr:DUF4857 domain-containing protein [Desulfobacteraceae bacterium]